MVNFESLHRVHYMLFYFQQNFIILLILNRELKM